MKMMFYAFAAAVGLTLAAAAEPQKQSASTNSAASKPVATNEVTAFQKVSSFVGLPIKNEQGAPIGKVTDLAFDLSTARIGYAVVSLTQEGQKARQVAVPLSALKPSENSSHFTLNVSQPVLAATESLVQGAWPPLDAFEVAVGAPAQGESGKASSSESK